MDLNRPLTWDEFKALPDDIKVIYIKELRQMFNVPNTALANMFGISAPVVTRYFKCLGLAEGSGAGSHKRDWDKDGFMAWCGVVEVQPEQAGTTNQTTECATPVSGEMTFEGNIHDIVRTIAMILAGKEVRLKAEWEIRKR